MKFVFKKKIYSFLKKDELFEIKNKEDLECFFEKCLEYLIKELENLKNN
jgi:hypothetical protein